MGIKNITKLLEKHSGIIRTEPVVDLVGSKIAVDTPIFLSKCLYISLREHFKKYSDESILQFRSLSSSDHQSIIEDVIQRFLNMFATLTNVTGAEFYMILEGPQIPSIKSRYAGARRLKDHQRCQQRYHNYLQDQDVEGVRKVIGNLNHVQLDDLTKNLQQALKKTSYSYKLADGESERTACQLRHEGLVDHIYTTDTDCLAMGQSMIKDIDCKFLEYTIIDHDEILRCLELEHSQFVDLCIMSGCDYNDNIPRVGVMNAYKLIQKYDSIEGVSEVKDIEILNHTTCRELFCLD